MAAPVDPRPVQPLAAPPDATVVVPGSKSITNRALLCAAVAPGTTVLTGTLDADDSRAMAACLTAAGAQVEVGADGTTWTVHGLGSVEALAAPRGGSDPAVQPGPDGPVLDAQLSGTTARFVLPFLALAGGSAVLDGLEPLRRRPMGDLIEVLRSLGAQIEERGEPGHLPVAVTGRHLAGGPAAVPGHVTSQFVSALLLAAPYFERGLTLSVDSLVAAPYVEITRRVMASFGVPVDGLAVAPGAYRSPGTYAIEPDASTASYLLAAAALCQGRVTVSGLGSDSMQGDAAFAHVLGQMGAEVDQQPTSTTVRGTGTLRGVELDLSAMPDMTQTVAALAPYADGPTTVRGVSVIRGHETDRIAAMSTELRRAGLTVEEYPDGLTIHPGTPRPTTFATYHDHRMAMSLALVGLRSEGMAIADPGCVAKTFPDYFAALDSLRR